MRCYDWISKAKTIPSTDESGFVRCAAAKLFKAARYLVFLSNLAAQHPNPPEKLMDELPDCLKDLAQVAVANIVWMWLAGSGLAMETAAKAKYDINNPLELKTVVARLASAFRFHLRETNLEYDEGFDVSNLCKCSALTFTYRLIVLAGFPSRLSAHSHLPQQRTTLPHPREQ